jgi:hypothetical protein
VLLVIPDPDDADGRTWRALLSEAVVTPRVVSADSFAADPSRRLVGRSLVVLPASAQAVLDTAVVAPPLRQALARGTTAVLDACAGPWAAVAHLRIVERRELDELPWPRSSRPLPWRAWAGGGPTPRPEDGPAPSGPLQLPHEVLVHRPLRAGVYPAASPFGRPVIWWTPQGSGGWLVQSHAVAVLDRALAHQAAPPTWRRAVRGVFLDPDLFPWPLPRADGPVRWAFDPPRLELWTASGPTTVGLPLRWKERRLVDWRTPAPEPSRLDPEGTPPRRLVVLPGDGSLEAVYRGP